MAGTGPGGTDTGSTGSEGTGSAGTEAAGPQQIPDRRGTPWYPEDYRLLVEGLGARRPLDAIARELGRSPDSLRARAVCLVVHPDDELAIGRRRNWLALLAAEAIVDPDWDWESRARAWHAARRRPYFDAALDERLERAWADGRETLPTIARDVHAREHEIADRCVRIGLARSRREVAEVMGCTAGLLLSRSLLPEGWGAGMGGEAARAGRWFPDPAQPDLGSFFAQWSWPPVRGPFDEAEEDPWGGIGPFDGTWGDEPEDDGSWSDGTWDDDVWDDDPAEDDGLGDLLDPSDPIWDREPWTGEGPLDPFAEDERAWAFEPAWEDLEQLDVLSFGASAPDPRGLWVLTIADGAWPFHVSVHRTHADAADVLDGIAPPPTGPPASATRLCHWQIAHREVAGGPEGDVEEGTFSRAAA
ncbi:hypothetical protein ACXET9_03155 [Brachybacterium sp. DNPG3]